MEVNYSSSSRAFYFPINKLSCLGIMYPISKLINNEDVIICCTISVDKHDFYNNINHITSIQILYNWKSKNYLEHLVIDHSIIQYVGLNILDRFNKKCLVIYNDKTMDYYVYNSNITISECVGLKYIRSCNIL